MTGTMEVSILGMGMSIWLLHRCKLLGLRE